MRPRWGFVEIVTDEGYTGWGEAVLEGHCDAVLACVNEYKTACNVVSKNFTEPYCITNDENSRDSAFECVKLSSVNKFSPSGNKTKLSDFTLRDILNNYCSLLYNSD